MSRTTPGQAGRGLEHTLPYNTHTRQQRTQNCITRVPDQKILKKSLSEFVRKNSPNFFDFPYIFSGAVQSFSLAKCNDDGKTASVDIYINFTELFVDSKNLNIDKLFTSNASLGFFLQ